jgi:23S rRNA (uridine2552-2'-O)-methyltransferase
MAAKSSSSRRWLREHFADPYVKQAQQMGYRSRAVFKLLEIQARDKIFNQGMTVVDLGAAPGGWTQLVANLVGSKGRVIALDILPMDPLDGVEIIHGDFTEDAVLETLFTTLANKPVDWVISDMAPNLSGIESVDQPRSIALAELALDLAVRLQGGLLVKVFQGVGSEEFIVEVRKHFKKVAIRKPKASRGRSREIYLLAR